MLKEKTKREVMEAELLTVGEDGGLSNQGKRPGEEDNGRTGVDGEGRDKVGRSSVTTQQDTTTGDSQHGGTGTTQRRYRGGGSEEPAITTTAKTRAEAGSVEGKWKVRTSPRRFDGELPGPRTAPPRVEAMDLDLRFPMSSISLSTLSSVFVLLKGRVDRRRTKATLRSEPDQRSRNRRRGRRDGHGGDEQLVSAVVTGGGVGRRNS
ncbi:hypothetical protein PIB30_102319, partial [Stylosanthes scabra]|nr:hypothetical protein [Stylosanthes scabra]